MTGRVWLAVVLAGLVVAGGAWGYREYKQGEACDAVRAAVDSRHADEPVADGEPVAVILGDSWAAGDFTDEPRRDAWSTLLGEAEGWETYVDGVPSTGFATGGYCGGQEYTTRVDAVLDRDPQVVIVQGGLNDDEADLGEVREAAVELLEQLDEVPEVYVVGPPDAPSREQDEQIDEVLASVSEDAGRDYVSTQGFELSYLEDGLHLTVEGHEQFAEQVAAAIG